MAGRKRGGEFPQNLNECERRSGFQAKFLMILRIFSADVGRRKDARLVGRTYSDDISGGYRFLQFVYRLQIGVSEGRASNEQDGKLKTWRTSKNRYRILSIQSAFQISRITLRVKRAVKLWTSRVVNWIDSFRLVRFLKSISSKSCTSFWSCSTPLSSLQKVSNSPKGDEKLQPSKRCENFISWHPNLPFRVS